MQPADRRNPMAQISREDWLAHAHIPFHVSEQHTPRLESIRGSRSMTASSCHSTQYSNTPTISVLQVYRNGS